MNSRTNLAITLIAFLAASPIRADRIAMPQLNPAQGFVQADVVVISKVKSIEKELVEAAQTHDANAPKTQYTVAVLDVQTSLKGAGNLTQIRVGVPVAVASPGGKLNLRGNAQMMQFPPLRVDQEGCFFLQKHPTAEFFVPVPFSVPIDAKDPNFKQQLAIVTNAKQVFGDPVKALKNTDKKVRYASLHLLLDGYRNGRTFGGARQFKTVDLPAQESKLMMDLISELPAITPDPDTNLSAMSMFAYLNPLPKDGWNAPKPVPGADYQKLFGEAFKEWVKANADTYRVKRFVAE